MTCDTEIGFKDGTGIFMDAILHTRRGKVHSRTDTYSPLQRLKVKTGARNLTQRRGERRVAQRESLEVGA